MAFYGALALTLLVLPALCYPGVEQIDSSGSTWMVTIPHHIDRDQIEFNSKIFQTRLELITWEHDTTRFIFTQTTETEWPALMKWVESVDREF
jgi:hypothetical protein